MIFTLFDHCRDRLHLRSTKRHSCVGCHQDAMVSLSLGVRFENGGGAWNELDLLQPDFLDQQISRIEKACAVAEAYHPVLGDMHLAADNADGALVTCTCSKRPKLKSKSLNMARPSTYECPHILQKFRTLLKTNETNDGSEKNLSSNILPASKV